MLFCAVINIIILVLNHRCLLSWATLVERTKELIGGDSRHVVTSIEASSWRGYVSLSFPAYTFTNNAGDHDEEYEGERDSKSNKNDEADGKMTTCIR